MAVIQISRVQVRRGLAQDLPQLAGGELGWAVDERRLYIGNGTTNEGAPNIGNTEILTQYTDILSLFNSYTFKGLDGGFEVLTGETFLDSVVRPLERKLDDFVNVRDFGAVGARGSDDTAAVLRALRQLYNNTNYRSVPEQHRTIHFPAGKYRISGAVLRILPWTKISGDGKACTELVQIDSSQPACVQLVDNFLQTGLLFGNTQGTNQALVDQYQIEDISIVNGSGSTAPAMLVDGGRDGIFNRVRFDCAPAAGPIAVTALTTNNNHSGVNFTGLSVNGGVKNFRFSQCDFVNASHGVEINNFTTKVSFTSCKFNNLYYGVVAGNNSPNAYKPGSVLLTDCVFDNIAAEAVRGFASVKHIISKANTYGVNIGRAGTASAVPVTAVIKFAADANYSIADRIDRSDADSQVYAPIDTGGFDCFLILPLRGTVSGTLHTDSGKRLVLQAAQLAAATGITATTSAIFDHHLVRGNESRQGTMKISVGVNSVSFDEEYSESGSTNTEFNWEFDVGRAVLKYTTNAGSTATLLYNLRFFN